MATGNDTAGGSTITQQLIKNLTGENQVSVMRKVKEIFMALNLEKKYTKDEILEAYLNLVNYGNGYYGVEAAAKGYFGKDIWDCNIAECANHCRDDAKPGRAVRVLPPGGEPQARELVISEMYDQGRITRAEYDEAMEQSANLKLRGVDFEMDDEEEETDTQSVSTEVWTGTRKRCSTTPLTCLCSMQTSTATWQSTSFITAVSRSTPPNMCRCRRRLKTT